ncbi:MAG: universal stress protein [Salibacteraceae bacterium]
MDVCKRIVVPVSFNKASAHSVGEALFLAQKNGAEVVLVHINTDRSKTERFFNEEFRSLIEKHVEVAQNIDISWRVIPGKKGQIVSQFAKTVDQLEPLFMVVGYDVKSKYTLGPNIKDIVYKTNYPVIALKSGETVRELNTILYPLTLEPNSRQKTNISIKLAKDLGLKIALFPMRLDNTKRDDKEENIIVNQLTNKFAENNVEHSVEWADGKDAIDLILDRTNYNKSELIGIVFESSPDFLDNFRTTREEKVLQRNTNPLLIVKSHHSPYLY